MQQELCATTYPTLKNIIMGGYVPEWPKITKKKSVMYCGNESWLMKTWSREFLRYVLCKLNQKTKKLWTAIIETGLFRHNNLVFAVIFVVICIWIICYFKKIRWIITAALRLGQQWGWKMTVTTGHLLSLQHVSCKWRMAPHAALPVIITFQSVHCWGWENGVKCCKWKDGGGGWGYVDTNAADRR